MPNNVDHSKKGRWIDAKKTPGDSQSIGDGYGVYPVHAALLHTGKVLLWSGHYEQSGYLYESWTWNPFAADAPYGTTGREDVQPFSPTHGRGATPADEPGIDLFCAHHVFVHDGKLLTIGGDTPSGHTNKTLHMFDPVREQWTKLDGKMDWGRWYPTAVLMPDGKVTIFSGDSANDIVEEVEVSAPPDFKPEVVSGGVRTYGGTDLPLYTYPGLHLVSGGEIFYTFTAWEYEDSQRSTVLQTLRSTDSFSLTDSTTGTWTKHVDPNNPSNPLRPTDPLREEGMSVLLPPAQDGRILLVGGGLWHGSGGHHGGGGNGGGHQDSNANPRSVEILETQGGSPKWQKVGQMHHPRINVNVVVLPDGQVLILGGHDRHKFNHQPSDHQLIAELFDPEVALDTGNTSDPFTDTGKMDRARMYHSVSLLLPDGSVFVAGGDDSHATPTTTGEPHPEEQKNYEIYQPPYFFQGDRPTIESISRDGATASQIEYGGQLAIETPDAASTEEVVLMRPGAITHHTDSEQRHVPLSFSKRPGEVVAEVVDDPSVAPPGYYMVFTLDGQSRPCERAEFVRLQYPIEVGQTSDSVTHEWSNLSFNETFPTPPVVVSSMQTFDGGDTASVRLRNPSATGIEAMIEEETSADSETNHTTEIVGHLATAAGEIYDSLGNLIGEAGTVTTNQSGGSQWHKVSLQHHHTNPVVLMQVMTDNGPQPAHTRVRNTTTGSFEFQIEEWDHQNQQHTSETIGYIVLESGRHRLSNQTALEVKNVQTDHTWTNVPLALAPKRETTIVSRCQTYNGHQAVVTRQRNVSDSGFEVRLQEEENNNGQHNTESVGCVAVGEPLLTEAGQTMESITHKWSDLVFDSSFRTDPVVVTDMQTFNGDNTAGVRLRNLSESGVEAMIEEETSGDSETTHTDEVLGYFAAGEGGIHDELGRLIGEAGTIEMSQPDGTTTEPVSLDGAHYHIDAHGGGNTRPVVFAQLLTYNGPEPAHIRFTDILYDYFNFKIEEWDYLDQQHTSETIGYIALEEGKHRLDDGTVLQVGTVETDHNWASVDVIPDLGPNSIALSHCQTANGSQAVVTRQRWTTDDTLEIRLQEEEGNNGQHVTERVGYLIVTKP